MFLLKYEIHGVELRVLLEALSGRVRQVRAVASVKFLQSEKVTV